MASHLAFYQANDTHRCDIVVNRPVGALFIPTGALQPIPLANFESEGQRQCSTVVKSLTLASSRLSLALHKLPLLP